MASGRHEDALEAVERRCPRCGAAREPRQEYCAECGLRLPSLRGPIPALRRGWIRRLGWYPGDWVWVSLLMLVVAAAGAAVAIAVGGKSSSPAGTTAVAPVPPVVATTTAPLPTAPEQTVPATTAAATTSAATTTTAATTATTPTTTATAAAPGRTVWPAGRNGWTIVLFSYPVTGGTAAPDATAVRAAADGLPQVGVLDSGDYASLHPGYYVVFSGVYSSSGEAAAALSSVRAAGFASAYTRQIAR